MASFMILHTNDIHGRIEGLARIATLVQRLRAENSGTELLYVDAGDIEEDSVPLSSLTRGVGMHRLLSRAGCQVATVGNGGLLRYGPRALQEYAQVARYPLLLANLQDQGQDIGGTRATLQVEIGGRRLGLIGVTAEFEGTYTRYFGLETLPTLERVRELAAQLRQEGVEGIILLSHQGLASDLRLAEDIQGQVDVIIGAHSHHHLPEGQRVGRVQIVQAGSLAEYVGRLDLGWGVDGLEVQRVQLLAVGGEIEPAPEIMAEVEQIQSEIEGFMGEQVGELAEPLDLSFERECGVGDLLADMLLEREQADVAIVSVGQAFLHPLPAGPLSRRTLWEASPSTGNPGWALMTGAQLVQLIARGLEPELAQETPRGLRGRARGLFHLSGARIVDGQLLIGERPVELEASYRVASSDWELDTFGGYADPAWKLKPRYETSVILREALEPYLAQHRPLRVIQGRVQGRLKVGD